MSRWRVFLWLFLLGGLGVFLVACEEDGLPRTWVAGAQPLNKTEMASTVQPPVTQSPMENTPTWIRTPENPTSTSTPQPCGLNFPLMSAGPVSGIRLFAGPHPVSPGASLFYCVTFEVSRYEIPPPLRFHLPEGARLVRMVGAGWRCTSEAHGAYGLTCTNARTGRGVSPLLLEVVLPATPGPWQACVEQTKPPSPRVCVSVSEE